MTKGKTTDWDGVAGETLLGLVKAAYKHQGRAGAVSGTDPARQPREVLQGFAESLSSSNQDTAAEFVRRYLKWAQAVKEEREAGVNSISEPSTSAAQQNTVASLVRRTRAHPKYGVYFNLPSYMEGWKRTERARLEAAVRPRLLALDCEMCATEDDDNALLGICLVDEFGAVVYRELVRPQGTIKDLRTQLTGVSEADLAKVTLTAKKALKAVKALLAAGADGRPTVLVGHSLHHDLRAVRLDHQPVIDTALIYSYRGLPDCAPGLKDLAKELLGVEMRSGGQGSHDSQEDAAVTMRLVMFELLRAQPTPPLAAPIQKVPPEQLCKLLVHGIPQQGVTEQQLRGAFVKGPAVVSVEGDLQKERKGHLVFKTAGDANEAFKRLPGAQHKDSLGRFFKQVVIAQGLEVKVRKMACHNGVAFGTPEKPQQAQKQQQKKGGNSATPKDGAGGKGKDKKAGQQQGKPKAGKGGGGAQTQPPAATGASTPQQDGAPPAAANGSNKRQKRDSHADTAAGAARNGASSPTAAPSGRTATEPEQATPDGKKGSKKQGKTAAAQKDGNEAAAQDHKVTAAAEPSEPVDDAKLPKQSKKDKKRRKDATADSDLTADQPKAAKQKLSS